MEINQPGGEGLDPSEYVASINVVGDPPLTGAVTFSEGANITLTQVGNDIEIATTGGSETLADVSLASTDATKSLYTMTATIPVEFRSSSGNSIFTIDESSQSVIFGKSSALSASQVWKNATNANTVTIISGVTSASYSLTLPTAQAGGAGYALLNDGTGVLSWGAASGGITALSAIGSSPNANGATITGSTLNLEPASASFGGVVTTGAQTFAGDKTFTGVTRVDGGAGTARLRITATNATDPKILSWATGDLARWAMRVDSSGDHIYLRRYDDAGAYVATPFEVRRDTGDIVLNELTASRVLTTDANKHVATSAVTTTELGYLSGVTSTVQGQYVVTTVTSTSSSPANTKDHVILLCDAATAGGNITVNLPTAVSNTAMFTIKKTDSGSNTIIIDPNSTQTIDGNTTFILFTQYDSVTVISDGSNWFII